MFYYIIMTRKSNKRSRKNQYRRSQKQRRTRRKSQRRQQRGGRVLMPSEFYGNNSGRYFPEGSMELTNPLLGSATAYGSINATSHGVEVGNNLIGPNLAPFPGSSGVQTGGRRH